MKSRDLMAVFESESEVRSLRPNMDLLARIDAFAVIATAPSKEVDFVSRFFASGSGVDEDPVTGSAHCALAPFWGRRLGASEMTGYQASARGGTVRVRLGLHRGRPTLGDTGYVGLAVHAAAPVGSRRVLAASSTCAPAGSSSR